MLKHPVKIVSKELAKIVPVFGAVFASVVSIGLVESAGWSIVEELEASMAKCEE